MVLLAEKIIKYMVVLPVGVGLYSWFTLRILDIVGLQGAETFCRIIWGLQ